MSLLISMAAFALASSISPGPVNMVALSAGAHHGMAASMRYVTGATLGFSLLLALTGLGLQGLVARWPMLAQAVQWAGVGFLLFMACKLAFDDGRIGQGGGGAPSLWSGAAMQWLNPKAWLASMAGMGAYAADGTAGLVWQFTAVYFFICYASIASWAWAGLLLRRWLDRPRAVRLFNRAMAALLAASAASLLLSQPV